MTSSLETRLPQATTENPPHAGALPVRASPRRGTYDRSRFAGRLHSSCYAKVCVESHGRKLRRRVVLFRHRCPTKERLARSGDPHYVHSRP